MARFTAVLNLRNEITRQSDEDDPVKLSTEPALEVHCAQFREGGKLTLHSEIRKGISFWKKVWRKGVATQNTTECCCMISQAPILKVPRVEKTCSADRFA